MTRQAGIDLVGGVWKPDTARLRSAIAADGSWTIPPGKDSRVVVEYPETWRETKVLVVNQVLENADLVLYDPVNHQWSRSNYRTGPEAGIKFLVPDSSKRWLR